MVRVGRGDATQIVDRYVEAIGTTGAVRVPGSVLERAFERVARGFSEDHGISYETWRDMGVPVDVLARCRLED